MPPAPAAPFPFSLSPDHARSPGSLRSPRMRTSTTAQPFRVATRHQRDPRDSRHPRDSCHPATHATRRLTPPAPPTDYPRFYLRFGGSDGVVVVAAAASARLIVCLRVVVTALGHVIPGGGNAGFASR